VCREEDGGIGREVTMIVRSQIFMELYEKASNELDRQLDAAHNVFKKAEHKAYDEYNASIEMAKEAERKAIATAE
jgi:hypothetical protein